MVKEKIKSILNSPGRKLLISNFFSLSLIQGANYLIPLLVLPYILRVIGPENFGVLTFAQTFIYYFTIIVNYSFDYSATREISIHRDDHVKVAKIYSSVFYCKLILFAIATLTFLITIISIDQLRQDSTVYFATYLINIGFVFFPTWFFQGIQQLRITAFFNLVAKILFAGALIFLVKEKSDYLLYAISNSAAQVFVGLISFFYGLSYYKIKLVAVSLQDLKHEFRGGLPIFFSGIAVSLYTNTNLIVLGWIITKTEYGYFSAALKIALVVQSLVILPLGMTLFPHIGKKMHESPAEGIEVIKKYIKWVFALTLVMSLLIFTFSEQLILVLFGKEFIAGAVYLKILAFLPIVTGINNMVSVQGLLNLKKDRQYFLMTLSIFALSLVLNALLVPVYFGIGTAVILLLLEIIMTISAGFYLFRRVPSTLQ